MLHISCCYIYLASFLTCLPDLVLSSVLGGVDTGELCTGLWGMEAWPVLSDFGIGRLWLGLLVGNAVGIGTLGTSSLSIVLLGKVH